MKYGVAKIAAFEQYAVLIAAVLAEDKTTLGQIVSISISGSTKAVNKFNVSSKITKTISAHKAKQYNRACWAYLA